jgi:hypothetical protein
MRRIRTLLAISLLLLFAWSRAADALPLVWCLGSNGHSAIELAMSKGCHNAAVAEFSLDSEYIADLVGPPVGQHRDCSDFIIAKDVRSLIKISSTTPTPPAPGPSALSPESFDEHFRVGPSGSALRPDLVANQLAQLRTVVLRI